MTTSNFILPLKSILKFFYFFFKLLPTKKGKILFLSRQADQLPLDFCMLKNKLLTMDDSLTISSVCCRHENREDMYKFSKSVFVSLYHLATSQVCVVDAYWPSVSILHHKKSLKVIQMWHSIGKVKSSGLATVGKPCGRPKKMAELLNMHANYDYVIAGGKAWNDYYIQSFGIGEERLLNYGLPRIDYLLESRDFKKEQFLKVYPQFNGKKIILYAPTFRKKTVPAWEELLDTLDFEKYVFILRPHKKQSLRCSDERVYTCPDFATMDLLCSCDFLITDYSAIAIEAAVINIPTYYYVPDCDDYVNTNGLNIDLFEEMPGCVYKEASSLMDSLQHSPYNQEALDRYRAKYLPSEPGQSTEKIAKKILSLLGS